MAMKIATTPESAVVGILDDDGQEIAISHYEEKAAEMVKACNAFAPLISALSECLNYIEHKTANEGKLTNAEQWAANVAEFRKVNQTLGIGRCMVPEAEVDLGKVRKLLASLGVLDNSGAVARTYSETAPLIAALRRVMIQPIGTDSEVMRKIAADALSAAGE